MKRRFRAFLWMSSGLIVILGCATAQFIGGPIAPDSLQDGVYGGQAKDGPVKAEVRVTVANHRITDIRLIKHRTWKGKAAENVIPGRIMTEQSTRVDAVSGATASSRAIMNAVEDAVRKAR